MKQMKFSYKKFLELYSDDRVCLDKFFKLRYGQQKECYKCHNAFSYSPVQCGKYYQCAWCSYKISPLAHTIFHKSSTNLQSWFLAIFLFSNSKNGIAAKELQRLIGVTYKTAWRMCKQIRTLFESVPSNLFDGIIEIDETYIGGKESNKHVDKKTANNQGRSLKTKTPILGLVLKIVRKSANICVTQESF